MRKKDIRHLKDEAERIHKGNKDYRRASNTEFITCLIIVLITALSIRLFIISPMRVDGSSMAPTLLDGERMIVEKVSYWFDGPERGDVVVCFYPNYTISCVKRVVGLPGETISITDGQIYINGEKLDETSYWQDYIYYDLEPVEIPAGTVFVIGDNRNDSKDSRNPSVGPIPYYRIVGRVIGVIWPLNEIKMLV